MAYILSPATNDRQLPERNPPWRATCAELTKRPGSLRVWERNFVASLAEILKAVAETMERPQSDRRARAAPGGGMSAEMKFWATFFVDYGAAAKWERMVTLPTLAAKITEVTRPVKDQLPWLKLGMLRRQAD